jgi:hypothetical protein
MTLLEWIESQPFQYTKVNVRPWGSYELQVSIDGRLSQLPGARGWGWTEKRAFEDILTEMMKMTNFHQTLRQWLGDERFNRITSILGGTDGQGDRTEVPSEIKLLEKGREDPSNNQDETGLSEQRCASENIIDGIQVDDQRENIESPRTE